MKAILSRTDVGLVRDICSAIGATRVTMMSGNEGENMQFYATGHDEMEAAWTHEYGSRECGAVCVPVWAIVGQEGVMIIDDARETIIIHSGYDVRFHESKKACVRYLRPEGQVVAHFESGRRMIEDIQSCDGRIHVDNGEDYPVSKGTMKALKGVFKDEGDVTVYKDGVVWYFQARRVTLRCKL